MTSNIFHCMKCHKNRSAHSMRIVTKPPKQAGVAMDYYRAKCPVCGSPMMKIARIRSYSRRRF